jgi:hypothetical protein
MMKFRCLLYNKIIREHPPSITVTFLLDDVLGLRRRAIKLVNLIYVHKWQQDCQYLT